MQRFTCLSLVGTAVVASCTVDLPEYTVGCPPGWFDDGKRCVEGTNGGSAGEKGQVAGRGGEVSGGKGGAGAVAGQGGDDEGGLGGGGSGGEFGGAAGGGNRLGTLGTSCDHPSDCAEGYCVDGVCCDAPCDEVCAECSAAGRCEVSEDDPSCPTVSCEDRICNSTSDITTNRCKARGECKTSTNCEYLPDVGLACGDFVSCQADGTCAEPGIGVVSCGPASCDASTPACCMARYGDEDGATLGCVSAGECDPEGTAISAYCDEHADCAEGELCSLSHIQAPTASIRCQTPASCDSIPANCYPICQSPAGSWPCPSGTHCVGLDGSSGPWTPIGFGYCASD